MAKLKKGELSERQLELISKALAEPRRLRILQEIGGFGESMPCVALCERHDIGPATMSHHVKELEIAGLISGVRKGKYTSYTLQRDVLKAYSERLSDISALAPPKS